MYNNIKFVTFVAHTKVIQFTILFTSGTSKLDDTAVGEYRCSIYVLSSFLDLDIFVNREGFVTKLYDKRRDFSFNVVTFANLKSKIPDSQAYGSFIGELYRICKSSTNFIDFKDELNTLVTKLVNQNFKINKIKHRICNFIKSKPACLHKYYRNINLNDLQ